MTSDVFTGGQASDVTADAHMSPSPADVGEGAPVALSGPMKGGSGPLSGRTPSWWPTAVGVLGWAAVAYLAWHRVLDIVHHYRAGNDLRPVRDAGQSVLDGVGVYTVPHFVYPPSAAVVGIPLTWVSFSRAVAIFAVVELAILLVAVLVTTRVTAASRWSLAASAIISGALIKGDLILGSAWLENATVLLIPPLVVMILSWGSGRWPLGSVAFALSLVFKPTLAPLVVIPFLARRWRSTAWAVGAAAALGLLSLPWAGGVRTTGQVVEALLHGSNLVGEKSVFNLSLRGMGEWHQIPGPIMTSARLVVVAVAIVCLVAVWRARPQMTSVLVGALAGLLLATTFLAGPLSEKNYLWLLVPPALACAWGGGRMPRGLVAIAGLLAMYSAYYVGYAPRLEALSLDGYRQVRYITIEVLVLAASAVVVISRTRSAAVRASPGAHADADAVARDEPGAEMTTGDGQRGRHDGGDERPHRQHFYSR